MPPVSEASDCRRRLRLRRGPLSALDEPMFVHCCHRTAMPARDRWPFAHHAMIEFSRFQLLGGEPEFVQVPTDSGGRHWVARCRPAAPRCGTSTGRARRSPNPFASARSTSRIVFSPRAHIFVRSRQAWFDLRLPASPPSRRTTMQPRRGPQPAWTIRAAPEMHQAQRRYAPRRGTQIVPGGQKPAGSDRPRQAHRRPVRNAEGKRCSITWDSGCPTWQRARRSS